MSNQDFRTDTGLILGRLIEAVSRYFNSRKLSSAVIMALLRGGIAVLSIGFVAQLLLTYFLGSAFDSTSVAVGFTMIGLALVLFLFERNRAKTDRPDIDFEPVSSFFKAVRHDDDDRDAKYIDGRNFDISATFRVKAGRNNVKLLYARMRALDRGIHCLVAGQNYRIGQKLIVSAWDRTTHLRRPVASEYNVDGDYNLQPPIGIPVDDLVNLTIDGTFGSPFMGQGAPFDFKDAELAVDVGYVVEGETKKQSFFFKSDYNTNGLERISALRDIPYFSNRELQFYHKKGCIDRVERDQLLALEPETRIRAMESRWKTPEDVLANHRVPPKTYETMLRLFKERPRLPEFDPDRVWRTPWGRMAKWAIDMIELGRRNADGVKRQP